MFVNNIKRVGFACKIQDSPGKATAGLNTGTTTITWLSNHFVQKILNDAIDLCVQSVAGPRHPSLCLVI